MVFSHRRFLPVGREDERRGFDRRGPGFDRLQQRGRSEDHQTEDLLHYVGELQDLFSRMGVGQAPAEENRPLAALLRSMEK